MSKHTNDGVCSACTEKLSVARGELVNFFYQVKEQYPNAHVSWSYRDKKNQDECNEKGTSKLIFPASEHNKLPSRAIDLFQINEYGAGVWDSKFCRQAAVIAHALDIVWGGDFSNKKQGDFDHFQLPSGS